MTYTLMTQKTHFSKNQTIPIRPTQSHHCFNSCMLSVDFLLLCQN